MDPLVVKKHHDRSIHDSTSTRRTSSHQPTEDQSDVPDDVDDPCVFHPLLQEDASLDSNSNSTTVDFQWSFSPDPYATLLIRPQPSPSTTLQYPTKEYLHDCFHPSMTDDLSSHKASSFYEQEALQTGNGLLSAVRRVFSTKCNTVELNPSWALIILLLLVTLIDLPYTKRASVCLVINLIIDVHSGSLDHPLSPALPVKLPVNDVEVKSFLTSHSHKNSLVSSLPIPTPIWLQHHSYIPISRQLQHASALGLIMQPIHIVNEQNHTVVSSNHRHSVMPKGLELLEDLLRSFGYNMPNPLVACSPPIPLIPTTFT
jgi:hypothetical protein